MIDVEKAFSEMMPGAIAGRKGGGKLLFVRRRFAPGLRAGALGPFLLLCAGRAGADPGALVLTHVTVIDAIGAKPRPDCAVLISGNRIVSVDQSVPPPGARVIDGRGKFLIPGLCDMHVH